MGAIWPRWSPRAISAVAQASASVQLSVTTVTEASRCRVGRPVAGLFEHLEAELASLSRVVLVGPAAPRHEVFEHSIWIGGRRKEGLVGSLSFLERTSIDLDPQPGESGDVRRGDGIRGQQPPIHDQLGLGRP